MSLLDPESRELLRAGRDALRPSLGDRLRVRDGLRARLEGFFHSPAPVPGPALTAGSGLGWLSVSALATSVVVGALLFTPKSPAPSTAPSVVSAPSQLPPAEAPVAPPAEVASAAPTASTTPPPAPPEPRSSVKPRQSDRLAQEVALLSRAETELHAGRFAAALQLLNMHQRSFPRGLLAQERVAARIQALCGLGRDKEANAELARPTPGSPHDAPTRQACGKRGSK